jgi:hypothetical protein
MSAYRIYCDESCHIERDGHSHMVLGAVWCPTDRVQEASSRLREIKVRHGLSPRCELKWGSVSPAKMAYFLDVLDYWADDDDLNFRAVVADKSQLRHDAFPGQDHEAWYYKMYFVMLRLLLKPPSKYEIFVDIKDTHSAAKLRKLEEVLCNDRYDFDRRMIRRVQAVRSHEVELIQLADFLIGITSYANRRLDSSPAKLKLVQRLRARTRLSLTKNTLPGATKINLLQWVGGGHGEH